MRRHALALWDGDGAVRLLAHEPARSALLIERCRPGTPLADLRAGCRPGRRLRAASRVCGEPAGPPFTTLADEAQQWAEALQADWEAAGRPFARSLLDAALDAIATLSPSQPEAVLVNQDLHALNIVCGSSVSRGS